MKDQLYLGTIVYDKTYSHSHGSILYIKKQLAENKILCVNERDWSESVHDVKNICKAYCDERNANQLFISEAHFIRSKNILLENKTKVGLLTESPIRRPILREPKPVEPKPAEPKPIVQPKPVEIEIPSVVSKPLFDIGDKARDDKGNHYIVLGRDKVCDKYIARNNITKERLPFKPSELIKEGREKKKLGEETTGKTGLKLKKEIKAYEDLPMDEARSLFEQLTPVHEPEIVDQLPAVRTDINKKALTAILTKLFGTSPQQAAEIIAKSETPEMRKKIDVGTVQLLSQFGVPQKEASKFVRQYRDANIIDMMVAINELMAKHGIGKLPGAGSRKMIGADDDMEEVETYEDLPKNEYVEQDPLTQRYQGGLYEGIKEDFYMLSSKTLNQQLYECSMNLKEGEDHIESIVNNVLLKRSGKVSQSDIDNTAEYISKVFGDNLEEVKKKIESILYSEKTLVTKEPLESPEEDVPSDLPPEADEAETKIKPNEFSGSIWGAHPKKKCSSCKTGECCKGTDPNCQCGCQDDNELNEKLAKCKKCGGEAKIYNTGKKATSGNFKGYYTGDWIVSCKQCDNEYHGCDHKPMSVSGWNKGNIEEGTDSNKTYSGGVSQAEISSYLNDLRTSGATNMFGAGAYIERDFNLSKQEAREALVYWMEHFEADEVNEASDLNKIGYIEARKLINRETARINKDMNDPDWIPTKKDLIIQSIFYKMLDKDEGKSIEFSDEELAYLTNMTRMGAYKATSKAKQSFKKTPQGKEWAKYGAPLEEDEETQDFDADLEETTIEDLETCPGCGSKEVNLQHSEDYQDEWYQCKKCGKKIEERKTVEEDKGKDVTNLVKKIEKTDTEKLVGLGAAALVGIAAYKLGKKFIKSVGPELGELK